MQLISPRARTFSAPTLATAGPDIIPAPPARWSRWYTSPVAKVEYGQGTKVPLFVEARIGGERGVTGSLAPAVTYAGDTLELAIAAARELSATPVDVTFSFNNGRTRTVQVNPAYAVLRDARAGAYFLAALQTTVQLRGEWVDAPHTIDGPAFEGANALLRTPTVLSATRDMVAVVGRDTVLKPAQWIGAPDDSLVDD